MARRSQRAGASHLLLPLLIVPFGSSIAGLFQTPIAAAS
jgi:hypothetical protein